MRYSQLRIHLQSGRPGFQPCVGKIPWRRDRLPTPVFLPGESHGQRSLVGCNPWGCKKLDTTEWLTLLPLPYDPAFPLLGIHPEKNLVQKDICTPVFSEGLFTIAKTRKQHKCPLAEEWIKKMWYIYTMEYSVQFSHSVVSDSLRPHESQHTRPTCPSPTPGVHSNSRPSSLWCHPTISSSVIPFSSSPQSLPVSESFPMSQFFAWGGQS